MATAKSSRGSVSDEKSLEKCLECNTKVLKKDSGMQCEICEKWWHAKCIGVPEEVYKVIQLDNFHWYCDECNNYVGKLLQQVVKLENRQAIIEQNVSEIEENLKKADVRQNTIESNVKAVSDTCAKMQHEIVELRNIGERTRADMEKMMAHVAAPESYAEIAEKVVETKIGVTSEKIQEMQEKVTETRELLKEEQDKETRRNNIIIYRVPESDSADQEERKHDDKRFVLQLFSKMQVGVDEEDLKGVLRLGRWAVSGNARPAAEPRPLLVQFGSRIAKNLVMENLFKLKHLEMKFKNVIIGHDMTQKERQECKKLVAEAKSKTDASGDFIYRVRGYPGSLKIVQLRKVR